MEILLIVLAVAVLFAVVLGVSLGRNRWDVQDRRRGPGRGETALREAPARPASRGGPLVEKAVPEPLVAYGRPVGLGDRVRALFRGPVTEETWRGLEAALIRADVGPKAAAELVSGVRESYRSPEDPAEAVTREVERTFETDPPWMLPDGRPGIVMVVGVNGTGKTTTIGKLAHQAGRDGRTVSLAASDTFRAAAGEQLAAWAGRTGAHLVSQERGSDPGAVAFDAVMAARARGSDVLIVDTAGRLHTKLPLMDELRKVKRVLEKVAGGVDEVLLVLDATTGQNGIAQARAFADAVDVTGVVLTKMDGTARGGIVLAVRQELGVPVKLVGVGEGLQDLVPFDPATFARRLVD